MNTKHRAIAIYLLAASLIISGYGPAQLPDAGRRYRLHTRRRLQRHRSQQSRLGRHTGPGCGDCYGRHSRAARGLRWISGRAACPGQSCGATRGSSDDVGPAEPVLRVCQPEIHAIVESPASDRNWTPCRRATSLSPSTALPATRCLSPSAPDRSTL